jgi:hypothetical protein
LVATNFSKCPKKPHDANKVARVLGFYKQDLKKTFAAGDHTISRRLPAGWVSRLLKRWRKARELRMVNSILPAIPNVFMACIDLDQAGIDAVDKLRNFSLGK